MAREIRLGNAVVGFRADVQNYLRNLSRAERAVRDKRRALRRLQWRMRQLQYRLTRVTRNLFNFRAAIALLASGGGLGLLVKSSSEAGASLFETSVRTGLAVEELQTLGRVLEGDGLSTEKFNKTLIKLNQSIGAGRLGLKSYIDAFEALGIDINEISGTADAVERIADALSKGTVDRATTIYALQTVAGRNASIAFNALAQGSEALREQQDEFAKLGIITTEQAARLKVLAQTQTDLGNAIKANSQRIVADLAGLINTGLLSFIEKVPAVFDGLSSAIQYTVANIRNLIVIWGALGVVLFKNSFFGRLIASIVTATRKMLSFRLAVAAVGKQFVAVDKFTVRFFPNMVRNAGVAATATLRIFQSLATGMILALRVVWRTVLGLAAALYRLLWPLALVEGIIITIEFLDHLGDELDKIGGSFGDAFVVGGAKIAKVLQFIFVDKPDEYLGEFVLKINRLVNKIVDFFRTIGVAAGKISEEVDKIFSGEASISGFAGRVKQIIDEAKAEVDSLDPFLPEIRVESDVRLDLERMILDAYEISPEQADRTFDAILNSAQKTIDDVRKRWSVFTGDIEDFDIDVDISDLEHQIAFVEEAYNSLEDTTKAAASEIERLNKSTADSIAQAFGEAAKNIILDFDNIGDAVKNLARTIINELANRIIAIPIANAVGGLFGSLFPGIPGLQGGGRGSGLTLVGEAGPELVDFRKPAQVYSNERLRDAIVGEASGGTVVNNYITVNSADAGAVERAIFDTLPVIVDTVKGAVNVDARRPSTTSAAFGTI